MRRGKMPRLSIIVPVYKVEQYIHKCIDSILSQDFKDFELILVDDGSPDNCGKICDDYAKKDSRISVIHKENGGLSDARNFGIEAAKGEIIGFIDSDDTVDENMYKSMIDYMDENHLDVVCADTYIVRNENKRFNPRYKEDKIWSHDEAINEILSGRLDNAAWNKIYKRSVIADIRYPKGRIYEDVATTYKFIFNCQKVGYMCKPFYNYYKRKGSIVASAFNSKSRNDNFIGYSERLEFAKKNNLSCVKECEKQCLETALATMTAFYANNEDNKSDRFIGVNDFIIKCIKSGTKYDMKTKNKMLLAFYENSKVLYKLYAAFSAVTKKAKNI